MKWWRVFGRVGGPPAHRQIEVRTRPCLSQTGASLTSISRSGFLGMPMSSNVAAPSGSFGQRLQATMTHAPTDTFRGPSPLRPVRSGHVYSQNARADKILETVVRRTGARTVIPCTRACSQKHTLAPPFRILKGGSRGRRTPPLKAEKTRRRVARNPVGTP